MMMTSSVHHAKGWCFHPYSLSGLSLPGWVFSSRQPDDAPGSAIPRASLMGHPTQALRSHARLLHGSRSTTHANLHLHARAEPVQHRNQAVHCEAAEVGIGGWPPRVPSFLKTLWAGAPSGLPLPGWVFSSRKPSAAPSPVPGPPACIYLYTYMLCRVY